MDMKICNCGAGFVKVIRICKIFRNCLYTVPYLQTTVQYGICLPGFSMRYSRRVLLDTLSVPVTITSNSFRQRS